MRACRYLFCQGFRRRPRARAMPASSLCSAMARLCRHASSSQRPVSALPNSCAELGMSRSPPARAELRRYARLGAKAARSPSKSACATGLQRPRAGSLRRGEVGIGVTSVWAAQALTSRTKMSRFCTGVRRWPVGPTWICRRCALSNGPSRHQQQARRSRLPSQPR